MTKPVILAHVINFLRRRNKQRNKEASGVLIVSAGGLGDTILFSLLLPRFIKLAKKNERVSVLIRGASKKITFLFPTKVNIICVDFTLFKNNFAYRQKIKSELFEENFRLVVSTDYLRHPKLDEAMIKASLPLEAIAMEPRSWPKYNNQLKKNRKIFSRLFESGPIIQDKLLRWNHFANWLLNESQPPPKISFPKAKLKIAKKKSKPLCIIQPFSAIKEKQSPVELYINLLPLLPDNAEILVTGTSNDILINSEYEALLKRNGISFDNSSFEKLVPKLREAQLVISVDTALMHLAACLGTPTLCLASAAYIGEITPYAPEISPPNVRFVFHDMPCRSCLGNCRHPKENGMYPCVARINTEEVETAVRALLKTTPNISN